MKLNIFSILLFSCLLAGCKVPPDNIDHPSSPRNTSLKQSVSEVVFKTLSGQDTILHGVLHCKASVFIFLAPDCPLSQSYSLTLNEFSKKYSNNNICFYGVFPGTSHTQEELQGFQKKYLIIFPMIEDTAYTLVNIFKATITPEVFVIDSTSKILYSGRIDNWAYEVSKKRDLITEHDLQDALDCIVNNTPIAVSQTKAVGCFIEIPKK